MKFNEMTTLYEMSKTKGPPEMRDLEVGVFYDKMRAYGDIRGPFCVDRCDNELAWYRGLRPYYKAYPAISASLLRLKLDCKLSVLDMPTMCVLVRFATGSEPESAGGKLTTVLVHHRKDCAERYLRVCAQFDDADGGRSYYGTMSSDDDIEIESAISKNADSVIPTRLGFKVAVSVLLLASDPTIIQPDVLRADKDKFEKAVADGNIDLQQRLVDKAKRRGVVGWSIGEHYETIPHIRRPHPALVWTEKGRTVPRIVMRKGSVVHRQKLEQVPTGYITPDGVEVEV